MTTSRLATATTDRPEMSSLLVPRPYRVVGKVEEIADVVTLHVEPIDGVLPEFLPAQVSMVGAFGVGEAAISISSTVDNRDFHSYTIRRAGPITSALVDTPVGGIVTIRGPLGTAWPLAAVDSGQLLVIAGGLGIAPLRALMCEAVEKRDRFDRLGLVYGAKSPSDLVYTDEIHQWRQSGAEVALIVDEADSGWGGPVGVVPDLLGAEPGLTFDWADTTAFVCGPDIMMHFAAQALIRLGLPAERIWLTLERNMQCGNGLCGHCQLGPILVCRDGPVVNYETSGMFHRVKEL